MTNSSIEASSSGVKLSYLRFISDSAPGLVVLLLLAFLGGERIDPWWAKHKELKVLFAALSFLLATPVGLVINAVSYFLLGQIQTQIHRICFLSEGWPLRDIRSSLMVKETTAHFEFNANDWADRNDLYGELVESYRPDLTLRIEHLRGLKRFTRSVSLLSFVCFFYLTGWCHSILVAVVVFLWFLWIWFASRQDPEAAAKRQAKMRHELWILILLSFGALIMSSYFTGVTWRTIDPAVDTAFRQICILAVALWGLLLAGMVDFFQRATIAFYLHIECPQTVKDSLTGISSALARSARRLRLEDQPRR